MCTLRSRTATVALQLEQLQDAEEGINELMAHEVDLAGVELFAELLPDSESDAAVVNAMLRGEQLYFAISPEHLPFDGKSPRQPRKLAEIERWAIEKALEENAGNRTRAAAQLGISLRTLQYRLKEYGEQQHAAAS